MDSQMIHEYPGYYESSGSIYEIDYQEKQQQIYEALAEFIILNASVKLEINYAFPHLHEKIHFVASRTPAIYIYICQDNYTRNNQQMLSGIFNILLNTDYTYSFTAFGAYTVIQMLNEYASRPSYKQCSALRAISICSLTLHIAYVYVLQVTLGRFFQRNQSSRRGRLLLHPVSRKVPG